MFPPGYFSINWEMEIFESSIYVVYVVVSHELNDVKIVSEHNPVGFHLSSCTGIKRLNLKLVVFRYYESF